MSLVTPDEVIAAGADGGLATADLQSLIDDEEAELIRRFGAHYADAPVVEVMPGGYASIYLSRAIESIASITEAYTPGDMPITLLTTDYYAWVAQGRIERLPVCTRWGRLVTVTYTPEDDTALRRRVLIELVRIASDSSVGGTVAALGFRVTRDESGTAAAAQREAQYSRLAFVGR